MRIRIEARDIDSELAARRLGLTRSEFDEVLPALLQRGFPQPDPTTGKFDLDAIDEWRRQRHPRLYGLTASPVARDGRTLIQERLQGLKNGKT
jgi:hypothetical protein